MVIISAITIIFIIINIILIVIIIINIINSVIVTIIIIISLERGGCTFIALAGYSNFTDFYRLEVDNLIAIAI